MAARTDPYTNFNFLVEIDGITAAGFQEVSGVDISIDVIEHREGGENISTRKYPGQVKFSNIVLKRGLTDSVELYDWFKQWADGDPAAPRKNGSIVMLTRSAVETVRWNFFNGWPSKWTGPALNAEQSDIAIETLEIVHERLERA
ncbi:phage tail protein [Variovorax sp. YR752]|uniref:phage tail protein n=1 Tax=Variovorax sp. YR752 TaxID=1884383 RepID=UPI0031383ABE